MSQNLLALLALIPQTILAVAGFITALAAWRRSRRTGKHSSSQDSIAADLPAVNSPLSTHLRRRNR